MKNKLYWEMFCKIYYALITFIIGIRNIIDSVFDFSKPLIFKLLMAFSHTILCSFHWLFSSDASLFRSVLHY